MKFGIIESVFTLSVDAIGTMILVSKKFELRKELGGLKK
jgi:hypothetical protein